MPGDAAPDARAYVDDAATAMPAEFDLGGDFSFSNNPNGPWRYGFSGSGKLPVETFMLDTVAVEAGAVAFWHPAAGGGGYYPYIAKSSPDAATSDASGSWALRPGQVALEASPTGQYSVVEFVAPQSGAYEVVAEFEGIHFRLSTTDVLVYRNGDELFGASIDGYGGDSAVAAMQGANPRASYHATLQLDAGDHLGFAVGYGENHSNTNDTTGLALHIRRME